jgi:hypothetical protein
MLFIENKYTSWYFTLIANISKLNRNKNTGQYYERHHIIPKSLGGSNASENLVLLSAREHFIAHLLLSEMCICQSHSRKMKFALQKMMNNPQCPHAFTSSQYELARIKNLKGLIGRKFTDEHKLKISLSNLGQTRSDATKMRR